MVSLINLLKNIGKKRNLFQGTFALFTNLHIPNFFKGTIYTGKTKSLCVPGLNCYSCPGAAFSCPIGSFQALVGSSKFNFAYYVTGLMFLFGTLFGRLICGFMCPFGFFQDLLYKIPTKKFSTRRFSFLKYLKYFILIFVVWLFGVFLTDELGGASPYFCQYICPQGILEGGIPLSLANKSIRGALGNLFILKFAILAVTVLMSIFFYRPFCKYICPLGAFYAITNKFSFYKYHVDDSCISCGKCKRVCKMDVDMSTNQNALECIRCSDCLRACPTSAISTSINKPKTNEGVSYE